MVIFYYQILKLAFFVSTTAQGPYTLRINVKSITAWWYFSPDEMCVWERKCQIVLQFGDYKGQGLPDRDSLTPIRKVYSEFYILLSCNACVLVFDDVIMHLVSKTCQSFTFVAPLSFKRLYDINCILFLKTRGKGVCREIFTNTLLDGVERGLAGWLEKTSPHINVDCISTYGRRSFSILIASVIFSVSLN